MELYILLFKENMMY